MIENLSFALVNAFEIVFRDILIFLPKFVFAFIILVVLVWVAKIVSKLIGDLLRLARIDSLLARIGITQAFHDVGFQVSIAYAVQVFVKWILVIVAITATLALLGLDQVVFFLEYGLFAILPEIITLGLMLFLTIFAANKLKDLVSHSTFVVKHHSPFLANMVWLAVVFFGVIATLQQLEILEFLTEAASGFVQALSLGIALALGLAFGLGCKEEARCLVRSWMGKECYDLDCGCNTFGCAKCTDDWNMHEDDCDCDSCDVK
jgi:hypothetical protein